MSPAVTFEEYLASLSRLTSVPDPTLPTPESLKIRATAKSLAALGELDRTALATWAKDNPGESYVLGLVLGMTQERLYNIMRQKFGTTSIRKRSIVDAEGLVEWLDSEFELVRLLKKQIEADYSFGDVLVARAGSRARAAAAGTSGRSVEDEIEQIAKDLGLPYKLRTRFRGRQGRTAPCDLAIPTGDGAIIAVAAKNFTSTGSKLTAAVSEVADMADVRLPRQFICAVVDGMGWLGRRSDLRRLYDLWETDAIDGLYTLSSLDRFRADIAEQARLRGYDVGPETPS